MSETLQTVRIHILSGLSKGMADAIRSGQMESAKVWTVCRDELHRCMSQREKWPNRDDLQKLTKGRFALHSQSVQMVCHAFLANVDTAKQLRKSGRTEIRYPWRDKTFYPLLWPKQAVSIQGNKVILPMGRGRASIVFAKPDWLEGPAPCKLIWNRNHYEAHFTVEIQAVSKVENGLHATVDLGQIHQCAVTTNDGHGLVVSGRGIRSEKRRLNKMHSQIAKLQSRCKKGSRRWKKLQRSRNDYALRSERRIRDLRHKGTRQVIEFCRAHGVSSLFIGNPEGVRQRRCGRKHNQRMSQWEYGKDIDYLTHKSKQAGISSFTGSERGTSSRCPVCGHRHKPKDRNWVCPECGFKGHRDLVGSVNMHLLAFGEKTTFPAANAVTYLRPGTSARKCLDRSSRPDTGHAKPGMLLHENTGSTASEASLPWVARATGQTRVHSSEAHSL